MTGIAGKESTWLQFGAKCGSTGAFTLFGKSGQWPAESCGVGNYVGLMQIPANMADAYDWTQNTLDGVHLFANDKLGRAGRYEAAQRSKYPKLPALSLQQSEYDAVAFYGPPSTIIAKTGLAYWIPNTNRNGWVKNPNKGVTSYVDAVYSKIR